MYFLRKQIHQKLILESLENYFEESSEIELQSVTEKNLSQTKNLLLR